MMIGELAIWLDKELKRRGWSQRQLARECGVSHVTISRALNGETTLRSDTLALIAAGLKMSVPEMLRRCCFPTVPPARETLLAEAHYYLAKLSDEELAYCVELIAEYLTIRDSAEPD